MVDITITFTKAERLEGELLDLLKQVELLEPATQIDVFQKMLNLSYNLAAKLAELRVEDAKKAEALENRVWNAPWKLNRVMEECWSMVWNAACNVGKKDAEKEAEK